MLQHGGDDQIDHVRFDAGLGDECGQSLVNGGQVVSGRFDMAVEQQMLAAVMGFLSDKGAICAASSGLVPSRNWRRASIKKASPRGKVDDSALCQAVATGLLPSHHRLIPEFRKNRLLRTFIARGDRKPPCQRLIPSLRGRKIGGSRWS
jgi:hypothetical protein